MVKTPALFDTCILIDYLRAVPDARSACDRYSDRAISIITWMEVMAGATTTSEPDVRAFLLNFNTLPLTTEIAELAVTTRKTRGIKLPDAIIQATAEAAGRILLTRNTRDFPRGTPGVQVPYTL